MYSIQSKWPRPDFLAPRTGSELSQISLQQFRHVRKLVYHRYVGPAKSPPGTASSEPDGAEGELLPWITHIWLLTRQQLCPCPHQMSQKWSIYPLEKWTTKAAILFKDGYSLQLSLKLNLGEQCRQNLTDNPDFCVPQ